MDHVLETIDRGDFAVAAFVGAAYNRDFIIFADRDGFDLSNENCVSIETSCIWSSVAQPVDVTDVRCAFLGVPC